MVWNRKKLIRRIGNSFQGIYLHKVIHNRTGKQDISGKIIRNSSALWITFIDNPKKFRHFFGKTYVKAELLRNLSEILHSALTNRMLMYDAGKGEIKEEVRKLYKNLFRELEILEIESGIFYRARKIDKQKDVLEKKKIIMTSEGKVCGFDEENSGVPSKPEDRKVGRLNRQGEPVLYIANDIITCLYEVKPKLVAYISVARFEIENPIRILNFTPFYKTDYTNYFSADVVNQFEQKGYSCQELFCGIQEILTMPDFQEKDYQISNEIADIIKEVSHELGVDGISYPEFPGKSGSTLTGGPTATP